MRLGLSAFCAGGTPLSDGDDVETILIGLGPKMTKRNFSEEFDLAAPAARLSLEKLARVMAALRTPVTGCPWDLEQSFDTIAPYTIEEAYEVADAIQRNDIVDLKDELGDLLLQVVYHAQMAKEQNSFDLDDVIEAITSKMIWRHPHVFGDERARSAVLPKGFWEEIKASERAEKAAERARMSLTNNSVTPSENGPVSVLDNVPIALPSLTRAVKLQAKAARVGFDWPSIALVFEKMREELAELELEVTQHRGCEATASATRSKHAPAPAGIQEEFGDLLFVMANVARHLDIDPEAALSSANAKFIRRFNYIEGQLASAGSTPEKSTLEEMDALWNAAKSLDKESQKKR